MKTFIPNPVNTDDMELPEALGELTEQMARNVHDVWAKSRIEEGWRYGEQRNDRLKEHPCLVSYDELPETEREYDRKTATQTLKLILKLGFEISKKHDKSDKSGIFSRIRHINHILIGVMAGILIMAIILIIALALAPCQKYDSWLIISAITITGICTLCWLGCYCKHLLKIYSDSQKEILDTELSLYREAVRRKLSK